jgi:tRNA(Ile2) C34 agmatinyltransferase TiaS
MEATQTLEVLCPHCSKPFASTLLGGGRHSGFKCPHCKLFVPADRAGDVEVSA